MEQESLENLVRTIVKRAAILKDKHIDYTDASVNYTCIFSHSDKEYRELLDGARKLGREIQETPSGFLFHIKPLETVSGYLKLLKIRFPDPTRPERGDADFTIPDFSAFEKKYLSKSGFKIMQKKDFYMIELMDPNFDVRAYFSNPPLDEQLDL